MVEGHSHWSYTGKMYVSVSMNTKVIFKAVLASNPTNKLTVHKSDIIIKRSL
jgi:hypothetical protein